MPSYNAKQDIGSLALGYERKAKGLRADSSITQQQLDELERHNRFSDKNLLNMFKGEYSRQLINLSEDARSKQVYANSLIIEINNISQALLKVQDPIVREELEKLRGDYITKFREVLYSEEMSSYLRSLGEPIKTDEQILEQGKRTIETTIKKITAEKKQMEENAEKFETTAMEFRRLTGD